MAGFPVDPAGALGRCSDTSAPDRHFFAGRAMPPGRRLIGALSVTFGAAVDEHRAVDLGRL
jgi:hypothetical protein